MILELAVSPAYRALLGFFALYPLFSSIMWVLTAGIYFWRREVHGDETFYELADEDAPMVSVVIPSFHEGLTECGTMGAVLELDYPNLEIFVVDDGSADDTLAKARSFLADDRVRVVHKRVNEGKALALNDVLPLTRGEYIYVIDGDAKPHSDALRWMVPHFLRNARLGAVTGHPVVRNRDRLLAKVQTVEFASIVSLLKRAQVVWGRVMTVSGVATLWRKSALEDTGLFVHDAATEDISTSWRLQRRHYDIRYEPRAMVDMQVPPTLGSLWKQRARWAQGLAQVLRRNGDIWLHWKDRRFWPVYLEATASIVWAYTFVLLTIMWLVTWLAGMPLLGATPVPAWWGMLIATTALVQLFIGVRMDRRYDPEIVRYFAWASVYPVVYWIQMALITAVATPGGWLSPYSDGRWQTERSSD
jgi:biofilm PGA synthesis N-glycosyltransferase PgaC